MDAKTLSVLEFHKVLERLSAHCDFSASRQLALALEPTTSYDLALARLGETSEARRLLSITDMTIGGAHDIREHLDLAVRGGVLDPQALLDVKGTLISCREIRKSLERQAAAYPRLAEISLSLPSAQGLVDAISRVISDRGDVLDSASPKLAALRAEMRVSHERLMTRLQRYITDPKTTPMLQDTLITQRDGRYVIPLRSEFKGQIKSIVHDQSSSGATLFVEPLAIVELNNAYREVQLAERDEVRRVLAEVSGQVALSAADLRRGVEALAELDLALAKAKYAEEILASEPILLSMKPARGRTQEALPSIKLLKARHPLLDPAMVVPIDVDPAAGTRAVVITGPNTGGKTVSLKTVGLLALMAQSGLHIPAQSGSELPLFQAVWADIGDEQSIEQSLSTFSGHITNIIRILKKADSRALVILDELGAGTDPQEGAALARAILQKLLDDNITTLVATHYPELKTFAHSTPGVVNASLEFDIKTLRPTYKLTIGLPGRSNALAIAERLGLPEAIIAAARQEINPLDLRADKLLDDIRKERNRASREREKAEKARLRAEEATRSLEKRLETIEDERREILARARAEAELEVEVLKRNIETLRRQLKKARQPLEALKEIEEKAEAVESKVAAPIERKLQEEALPGTLKLGEKVLIRSLGNLGIITALGQGEAEVQIGSLRLRTRLSDLVRAADEQAAEAQAEKLSGRKRRIKAAAANLQAGSTPTAARPGGLSSPGLELDLRGQVTEDALEMLENFLDRAYLASMPFVRIIHGKGTGKLRSEVRAALKGHPHVASFEIGLEGEGGDGVTVAKIVKE